MLQVTPAWGRRPGAGVRRARSLSGRSGRGESSVPRDAGGGQARVGRDEVRAFLEKRIRAWEQADFEAMMADYAPDIVHISPSGRREGVEALRVANQRYLAEYTDVRVELTRLLV